MYGSIKHVFLVLLMYTALLSLLAPGSARSWDRGTVAYSSQPVVLEPVFPDSTAHLIPGSVSNPEFGIKLSSYSSRRNENTFLYLGITDFKGNGIQDFRIDVRLPAASDTVIKIVADSLAGKPGFYDVRALLFQRGRELGKNEFSFGYDVGRLDHDYSLPTGFDSFWSATLDTLAAVPAEADITLDSRHLDDEAEVFRISFTSLHGVRVFGWMTLPVGRDKPAPGLVLFPGYSTGKISPAVDYSREGFATVSIQVRGYGVDQESYPEDNSQYMTIGCESPQTYIYREIICHCLRAVELLAARPEVDPGRIAAVGGSQGGGLSLMVAGLNPKIAAVVANVPFLTDFQRSMTMCGSPYRDLVRYIERNPASRDAVMDAVRYFDTTSLAGRIEAPIIVSAGLFDRTCPAPSIYRMFLALGSTDKRIEIYPWLDHLEVGREFMPVAREWLLEHLAP